MAVRDGLVEVVGVGGHAPLQLELLPALSEPACGRPSSRLQKIARKRAPTSQRLRSAAIGLGIAPLLH
jgi:hypothetical protein